MSTEKDTYLNRFLTHMLPTTNTAVNGVAPIFNSPEQTLDPQISPEEASRDLEQFAAMVNEQVAGSAKNAKLAAIRARMPFVEIMPLPDATKIVTCTTNVNRDVQIPDGAILMKVTSFPPFTTITMNGANPWPTIGAADESSSITVAVSAVKPNYYFIDGLRSLSLCTSSDTKIFFEFWVQI